MRAYQALFDVCDDPNNHVDDVGSAIEVFIVLPKLGLVYCHCNPMHY